MERTPYVEHLPGVAFAILVCLVMAAGCDGVPTSPVGRIEAPRPVPVSPTVGTQAVDARGVISANHGHAAVLTLEQMQRRAAVQLDIQGSADHSHTLDLDADDVVLLYSGGGLTRKSSTTAGHDHDVRFVGHWDY